MKVSAEYNGLINKHKPLEHVYIEFDKFVYKMKDITFLIKSLEEKNMYHYNHSDTRTYKVIGEKGLVFWCDNFCHIPIVNEDKIGSDYENIGRDIIMTTLNNTECKYTFSVKINTGDTSLMNELLSLTNYTKVVDHCIHNDTFYISFID